MWNIVFLIALAFSPFATHLEASDRQSPCPSRIQILINHDLPGALIEVKGKYELYDPKDFSFIGTRYIGKRRYMQALTDGLQWGEEFPGLHQIMIVPESQNITTIVDGVEYSGSIYIYDVNGTLGIVNEIDIEDYLQSILGAKAVNALPQEALAALAIVERTSAFYYMEHPKNQYWAINALDVQYKGYVMANPSSPAGRAVSATRNLVLSQPGDQSPNVFPASFDDKKGYVKSKISISDAVQMAMKGANAADILAKAFPNAKIELSCQ
jgi:stage II sporulation protein D